MLGPTGDLRPHSAAWGAGRVSGKVFCCFCWCWVCGFFVCLFLQGESDGEKEGWRWWDFMQKKGENHIQGWDDHVWGTGFPTWPHMRNTWGTLKNPASQATALYQFNQMCSKVGLMHQQFQSSPVISLGKIRKKIRWLTKWLLNYIVIALNVCQCDLLGD